MKTSGFELTLGLISTSSWGQFQSGCLSGFDFKILVRFQICLHHLTSLFEFLCEGGFKLVLLSHIQKALLKLGSRVVSQWSPKIRICQMPTPKDRTKSSNKEIQISK
jgi:hypothetical protein